MSTAQYKAMVTKNLKMMFPHIPQQEMRMIVECIFKLVAATDNAALAEPVKKIDPKPLTEGQQKKKNKEVEFRARKKQEAADRKEARQTPPAADQQKQATTEESSEKAAEKPQRMYDARPFGPHKM